jgi:hypothetical protein
MKLMPKNRLHLVKQNLRTLIEADLAKAQGGATADTCKTTNGATENYSGLSLFDNPCLA